MLESGASVLAAAVRRSLGAASLRRAPARMWPAFVIGALECEGVRSASHTLGSRQFASQAFEIMAAVLKMGPVRRVPGCGSRPLPSASRAIIPRPSLTPIGIGE